MIEKTPYELSREYYHFVNNFIETDFEDEKILGKFYTDSVIAESMIQIIGNNLKKDRFVSTIRIIDPFCGDGRLIIKLLSELLRIRVLANNDIFVSVWDIDNKAVRIAEKEIRLFCKKNNILCKIDARVVDAFVEYKEVCSTFNICVTNPPWSLLKPQKLFSKSKGNEAMEEYCHALEQYDAYMKEEFIISQPSSKFGKWGTNLARCGIEVALRLIKYDGICGFVSPASLLNDQVSSRLRCWLFEKFRAINISYYPAELKLYGSADISSITMIVRRGEIDQSLNVRIYRNHRNYIETKIENDVFEYIKRNSYCISLKTGIDAIPIMMNLEQLPTTQIYCECSGLSFTRELDETRVKEKLVSSGKIEFAKGYMVDRYMFASDSLFLNEDITTAPQSSYCNKIVWRDVSRDSQKRRIKATLLPPGYICGNSLGVIYGEEEKLPYLKMLLAIMNSMVYEYQAKGKLVSNHVATGIVKKIHVPAPILDKKILELVDRQLKGEDVEAFLELAVAKKYGISVDEYRIIIDSFDLPKEKKEYLIGNYT